MKGGKYTKTLAKIWVEGMIRIRDIRRNVVPKFKGSVVSHYQGFMTVYLPSVTPKA